MIIEQFHFIHIAMQEAFHQIGSQVGSLLIRRFVCHVLEVAFNAESQLPDSIRHLLSYRENQNILQSQRLVFCQQIDQVPDDIGIKPAAQTGIGSKHHDSHLFYFTLHNERRRHLGTVAHKIGQYMVQPAFVRKHTFYGSLSLMQFG